MGSLVMLSLATEQLDSLMGVLVWQVCYVITSNRAVGQFDGSAGMASLLCYH